MQPESQLIDGKYDLVAVAGEGGMATVYRAVQKGAAGFQRTVAIKHIKPEFRALKNYIDMFIEEARVGSELQHPNIVQVHDFVSQNGSYYLVMEWVEGIDLGALHPHPRRRGIQMPWPLAVAIGIGTLRGLGAAHDRRGARRHAVAGDPSRRVAAQRAARRRTASSSSSTSGSRKRARSRSRA